MHNEKVYAVTRSDHEDIAGRLADGRAVMYSFADMNAALDWLGPGGRPGVHLVKASDLTEEERRVFEEALE